MELCLFLLYAEHFSQGRFRLIPAKKSASSATAADTGSSLVRCVTSTLVGVSLLLFTSGLETVLLGKKFCKHIKQQIWQTVLAAPHFKKQSRWLSKQHYCFVGSFFCYFYEYNIACLSLFLIVSCYFATCIQGFISCSIHVLCLQETRSSFKESLGQHLIDCAEC